MTTSSGSKAIGISFKYGFPFGFQCIFNYCLSDSISHRRDSKGTFLAICLRDVDPSGWFCFGHFPAIGKFHTLLGSFNHLLIYPSWTPWAVAVAKLTQSFASAFRR